MAQICFRTQKPRCKLKSFNKHHIDAEILMENRKQIQCTGVYSNPDMRQRKHTWTLLRRLSGLSSTPWLCFSDFNEILHPYEKSGGNERQLSLITYFREALRDCDLLDVGYKGYPFTQSNGRFGPAFVEEKLDRFVCNSAWRDIFSDSATTNIDTWTSNHCPVVMEVQARGNEMNFNKRLKHSRCSMSMGIKLQRWKDKSKTYQPVMKHTGNNAQGLIGSRKGMRTLNFSITRHHQERRRTKFGGLKMQLEDGLKMSKRWSMSYVNTSQTYSLLPSLIKLR